MYALWNVDEGSARPHGSIERCELVIAYRDYSAEVLLEDILVLAKCGVGIQEEHTLGFEVLANRVIHNF
ncbi:unannotated protein [freshwater metagenome]|uniref:Unannotated protein n=1 Tax=freshwater metagenome TaxID=449393 RepID=A0A6J6CI78_9ZZZZ